MIFRYVHKISKTYNIFFIDFQGLFHHHPLKQSMFWYLQNKMCYKKECQIWNTLGVTNGQHGEQQKVLILNSYIRIFFLFQEKKKKSLEKNSIPYHWHHKSLFLKKLKSDRADIILSNNYKCIFIYQHSNTISQRIREMSTDLMLITTHTYLKVSLIHGIWISK